MKRHFIGGEFKLFGEIEMEDDKVNEFAAMIAEALMNALIAKGDDFKISDIEIDIEWSAP